MAMTQAAHFGLAAFACNGRKEANVFTRMAESLVVVVGRFFVKLVESIGGKVHILRHVSDTRSNELRPEQ